MKAKTRYARYRGEFLFVLWYDVVHLNSRQFLVAITAPKQKGSDAPLLFWCGRQDMKAKTRYARYRGEVSFVGFEAFARRTSRQIRRVHRHTKKKRGTRPLFFLSMGYKKDIIGILQMNSNSHLTVSF